MTSMVLYGIWTVFWSRYLRWGGNVSCVVLQSLWLESFPIAPPPLGRVWALSFLYTSDPFQLKVFSCALGQGSVPGPSVLSPLPFTVLGVGVTFVTISSFLLLCSCHSLCLWLLSHPQFFFRRNCSVGIIWYACGEGELRVFLCHHLEPGPPLCLLDLALIM